MGNGPDCGTRSVRRCELINTTAKAQGSQRAPDLLCHLYSILYQYDFFCVLCAFAVKTDFFTHDCVKSGMKNTCRGFRDGDRKMGVHKILKFRMVTLSLLSPLEPREIPRLQPVPGNGHSPINRKESNLWQRYPIIDVIIDHRGGHHGYRTPTG